MEFKSQICTSVEQSKRLLELGLKKETADMSIITKPIDAIGAKYSLTPFCECSYTKTYGVIPAWSLHRLLCLYGADYVIKEVYNNAEECYGMLISAIGIAIEDGMFNPDYLEEKL